MCCNFSICIPWLKSWGRVPYLRYGRCAPVLFVLAQCELWMCFMQRNKCTRTTIHCEVMMPPCRYVARRIPGYPQLSAGRFDLPCGTGSLLLRWARLFVGIVLLRASLVFSITIFVFEKVPLKRIPPPSPALTYIRHQCHRPAFFLCTSNAPWAAS